MQPSQVRMNARMRAALERCGLDARGGPSPLALPPPLLAHLDAGFTRRRGAILLTELAGRDRESLGDHRLDETGRECWVNKIHLDDYAGEASSEAAALTVAVGYAHELLRRLAREFAGTEFLVIVSVYGSDAVARFHAVRPGQSWVDDDLDRYQEECVLTLSSRTVPSA